MLKAKSKFKHENDTQATSKICLMQCKKYFELIQGLKTEIRGQSPKPRVSRKALWLPVLPLLDTQAALGSFLSGEKGNFKPLLPVPRRDWEWLGNPESDN